MSDPTLQPAPAPHAAQATPAAEPAPAQQVAPGAPPAATAATPAGATPAGAPAEQAPSPLAAIAERMGLTADAPVEDVLERIEALSTPRPAEPEKPSKKTGGHEIPKEVQAQIDALERKAIQGDLRQAVSNQGWTESQQKLAMNLLQGAGVSFDPASGTTRGPRSMRLETMVRDIVAEYPDAFKPPAPNVPGHKMAPPNNGVMPAAAAGSLPVFTTLKF